MKILSLITFCLCLPWLAVAQDAQPKPTPVRRALDQFDLSDGIRVSSPSPATPATALPTVMEALDENTYGVIIRMIDYANATEQEFRNGSSQKIDPNSYFAPEKVLERKLTATYRILDVHRYGLLGQEPLKNDKNLALLKDNQIAINDMMIVFAIMRSDTGPYQGKLKMLSDRYMTRAADNAEAVEKQPLLYAMLAKMNTNFALLRQQLTIAK